jgi:hypothetical protein
MQWDFAPCVLAMPPGARLHNLMHCALQDGPAANAGTENDSIVSAENTTTTLDIFRPI